MNAINGALPWFFDLALWPFELLGNLTALLIVSGVFGVLALIAFKHISWQKGIKSAKDRIKGHMIEIRIYQDDLVTVGQAVCKILYRNFQYVALNFGPFIPLAIPFGFVVAQLVVRYGYDPVPITAEAEVRAGRGTLIEVELKGDQRSLIADLSVILPEGLEAISPLVRAPSDGRAFQEIVALAPGTADGDPLSGRARLRRGLALLDDHEPLSGQQLRLAARRRGRDPDHLRAGLHAGRLRGAEAARRPDLIMFGESIERALRASMAAHEGQFRKGGPAAVPYFTHPVHVGIMLARWGLEEHVIVAGILHDAVEDSDDWTLERVEVEFGAHVAQIVGQLTEDKSKTWAERKQWAVDHVPHMSPEAAAVKAADKIHNLQSLLADLRDTEDHDAVWSCFEGGRQGTLRMDGELIEALSSRTMPALGRALRATYDAVVLESERETRPELASGS